ncbi:MAG: helix-hairpin-helix domain-containing protein [Defluviitaleaceae bacterium]|nr:helix-hairpin-helix domain-containing protein [Defluviitaleaceae bacterium]
MIKKFARSLSLLLTAVFILSVLTPVAVHGQPYGVIPQESIARVVRIIDVNAIEVEMAHSGERALVRLIGVLSNGSAEGIAYLSREIMGAYVSLMRDPGFANVARWNYAYVSFQGRFINAEIVQSGFARHNDAHRRATNFAAIQTGEAAAQIVGLGYWANETRQPQIARYNERININTASQFQIVEHFETTWTMAQNITSFRMSAPLQHITDVKFVPGMTRAFFEQNRGRMGVSTNINTAIEEELLTVFSIAHTRSIISSRSTQGPFGDISQLVTRNIMSQTAFNSISPFISTTYIYEIDFSRPGFRANLNLASSAQLTRSGVSVAQANAIIQQRAIIPMRNVQDLLQHTTFSVANTNAISDNMRAFTNINTAPRSELESLFGTSTLTQAAITSAVNAIIASREVAPFTEIGQIAGFMPSGVTFATISPFIYVGERPAPATVNVNTASHAQLVNAGVPASTAQQIISANGRGNWLIPSGLPVFVRDLPLDVRGRLSVRTNINNATQEELMSLDAFMTADVVNRIMTYRQDQPFGSMAEVQNMFASTGQTVLYNRIARYIILR